MRSLFPFVGCFIIVIERRDPCALKGEEEEEEKGLKNRIQSSILLVLCLSASASLVHPSQFPKGDDREKRG